VSVQKSLSSEEVHKLDILFVVDNSASMAKEQLSMTHNIQALVDEMQGLSGGLPSLHIGVVSTDMGAGSPSIAGCEAGGDQGALHTQENCLIQGAFLQNTPGENGMRETNYEGSLTESFTCLGTLGTTGCGFEQPFHAVRAALNESNAGNAGFLRDDAKLAIIIVSDEDDCSASNTDIFKSSTDAEVMYGPLSSFRCTEFGLRCDGVSVSQEGSYQNCEPAVGPNALYHPDNLVTFLSTLKGGQENVMVAIIAGRSTRLEVTSDINGHNRVIPGCESVNGSAIPSYRLGYFAQAFNNHLVTSICNADLSGALADTGTMFFSALQEEYVEEGKAPESGGCSSGGTQGNAALLLLGLLFLALRKRLRIS